jgi:hypothetical protein
MASARASIGRLLHKLSSDQETSGSASPAKAAGDEGEGATPVTPASKKKAGGRKRKNGEFAILKPLDKSIRSETDTGPDAATTDNAEDESPTKKKASPAKRKSKATTNMADQEEETVVKSEAAESADDHA